MRQGGKRKGGKQGGREEKKNLPTSAFHRSQYFYLTTVFLQAAKFCLQLILRLLHNVDSCSSLHYSATVNIIGLSQLRF